jgi:predicted transcriptional regulator
MAVVSVRLNREEEKILDYLTEYFHEDKSSLFKKSMFELYEDIQDIKFIEEHIAKRKEREFISGEELFT